MRVRKSSSSARGETTLSGDEGAARREPGNGELEVRAVARASASRKTRSNGPGRASVSVAGPSRTSTHAVTPARSSLRQWTPVTDAGMDPAARGETAGWVIAIRIRSGTTR
jgi:hypothetical protein